MDVWRLSFGFAVHVPFVVQVLASFADQKEEDVSS